MWQKIAVYIVGAGVIAYVAGWVYRTFLKKGRPKGNIGCSSCCGCSLKSKEV